MKNLVTIVVVIILFTFGCAAFSTSSTEKKDLYKSFAQLYPDNAKEMGTVPLGGIIEFDGSKFKVIAEVKYPKQNVWFQFVDEDPFEDSTSTVGVIWFCEAGHIHFQVFSVEQALNQIYTFCKINNIKLIDILHIAPGIDKKKLFAEPLSRKTKDIFI
jgi:hypothetical protein